MEGSGFKSSEFFIVFAAHALVLIAPLVGYQHDPTWIVTLLGLDAGYMGLRGGHKIIATAKNQPTAEEVADMASRKVLNQLKGS